MINHGKIYNRFIYFGQSTMIRSILQSFVETASVVPMRNTHNVHVVDFNKEIFAAYVER